MTSYLYQKGIVVAITCNDFATLNWAARDLQKCCYLQMSSLQYTTKNMVSKIIYHETKGIPNAEVQCLNVSKEGNTSQYWSVPPFKRINSFPNNVPDIHPPGTMRLPLQYFNTMSFKDTWNKIIISFESQKSISIIHKKIESKS